MNVVFISPDFPPNFWPFCARLADRGHSVIGVSSTPEAELRPELRAALAGYYRVDSLENLDQVRAAVRWAADGWGPIGAIESLNEHWLETEAVLREEFGVPGWKPGDMAPLKHKSLMKARFVQAGVDVARGRLVPTPEALAQFIGEVGFPVVVKPDVGVGAARTYKLTSEADVDDFWATKLPVEYFAEEFVTGTVVTYDGIVDDQGEVVLATSMRYGGDAMSTVNDNTDIYFSVTREIPADLDAAGRRVARAFDVRARYVHFEFFRRPDGGLTALEVNMRPPGNLCVDMANFAHDMDMFAAWADLITDGTTSVRASGAAYSTYVSRKAAYRYALSDEEVLARYGPITVLATVINPLFEAIMGNRGMVLRHPEIEVVLDAVREIQRKA